MPSPILPLFLPLLLGTITFLLLLDSAQAVCAPEHRNPKFNHTMCAIVRSSVDGHPFIADLPDTAAEKFRCTMPCEDIHSPIPVEPIPGDNIWEMGEAWRCETEAGKECIVMTKSASCGYEWHVEGDCGEVEVWENDTAAKNNQTGSDGMDKNGKPNICYSNGTNAKVAKRFEVPPSLNCIPAGLINAEKMGKFSAEQANGAFLEDYYIELKRPTTSRTTTTTSTVTSTTATTTTTTPRLLSVSADECTMVEENVKPAYIEADGEYVVRIGYVHNIDGSTFKAEKNPFKEIYWEKQLIYNQSVQSGLKMIQLATVELKAFLDFFYDFFYMKIPSELVNSANLTRMVFHKCADITLGVVVKKAAADAIELEDARNDWSKDFDEAARCKRVRLMRIDEDEHSHQFRMQWGDEIEWLWIDAEVDLPVRIGITAKAGHFPNHAQLEAHRYYYGHRSMPRHSIREHLIEDLDNYARSKHWGRYLTDYDEFYKAAKEHSLTVVFKKITYTNDVSNFVFIRNPGAEPVYVQPELTQESYGCGSGDGEYQIYTSRFRAVQNTNIDGVRWRWQVDVGADGMPLRFANNTHNLYLDNGFYRWTIDPSEIFLKKHVPEGGGK